MLRSVRRASRAESAVMVSLAGEAVTRLPVMVARLRTWGVPTWEHANARGSPYSASKAGSDHLVRSYFHTFGLPITITNCSNNFGPFHFPEKFIPLSITNILEGKKVPIYGDGKYVRDWLYVDDHCRAIEAVLLRGKIGETYCVGGATKDISNLEVVHMIVEKMGKDDSVIEFIKDRPGHDRRYAIDWSKIHNELGWKPEHDFDAYLTKTIEWYKTHESWWRNVKSGTYQTYYKKQYGAAS